MTDRDLAQIAAAQRLYQAEQEVISPDIVWHVPGHNPVSGVYRGWAEYFDLMPSRMAPLGEWAFSLGDVLVNGDLVVVSFTMSGERKGRRIATRGNHVLRFDEHGRIAEGWGFVHDQDALDAFFSA